MPVLSEPKGSDPSNLRGKPNLGVFDATFCGETVNCNGKLVVSGTRTNRATECVASGLAYRL